MNFHAFFSLRKTEYQKTTATNLPALEPRYNSKAVYRAGNQSSQKHFPANLCDKIEIKK